MSLSAAEKKRRQRERKERGARVIRVEIPDWQAWTEILMARGYLSAAPIGAKIPEAKVAAATSDWIGFDCREHWLERAQAVFSRPPVTGLLVRESLGSDDPYLVKAKYVRAVEPINYEVQEIDHDEAPETYDGEGFGAETSLDDLDDQ